jgi:hypothetical protein
MSPEMYDKLNLVQEQDSVYITNNTNTYGRIKRILKVESNVIHTDTHVFNKHNLICINDPFLKIDDIYFNINGRIKEFLLNKKYSIDFILSDDRKIIYYKYSKSSRIEIIVYKNSINYKHSCYVVSNCNNIQLLTADIFEINDFNVIYKCIFKKFD